MGELPLNGTASISGALVRAVAWLAGLAAPSLLHAAADPYIAAFHDVEQEALLQQTQIDAAAPEPGGFTALDVAPFRTAQTLTPFDLSFAAMQSISGPHRGRTTLAIDFSSLTLLRSQPWQLSDYKGHHDNRVVTRAQLSIAASKGEGERDRSLRIAPALRVVLHQERDPRVHRGPGSLEDCFERNVALPDDRRAAMADLGHRLDAVEQKLDDSGDSPTHDDDMLEWQSFESQWEDAVEQYRHALHGAVQKGMETCREDPELSSYAWNSTGLVVGGAPTLVANSGRIGDLAVHGYSAWATVAYGFDARGTLRNWAPGFLGHHAQVLSQFTFRHDQMLQHPGRKDTPEEANQYAYSLRLRGGTAPLNGSVEATLLHDDFDNGGRDTYTALAAGVDLRVRSGTWLSASLERTFSRGRIPDRTSLRMNLQWSVF